MLDQHVMPTMTCVVLRSLERVISWQAVAFRDTLSLDAPVREERRRVTDVIAEADDPDYWFSVSKDGNREQHYRGGNLTCGQGSFLGPATCTI